MMRYEERILSEQSGEAKMLETKSYAIGLSILIPAYNEEESLGKTVFEVREAVKRLGSPFEIMIIDDGSDDGTFETAQMTGEHVVRHSRNRGYGAALKTGIRRARFSTIGIIDADGTYPPQAFAKLVELLKDADMSVGSRSLPGSAIPMVRRPGKWILRKVAEYITLTRIDDLNSGLRVFPKDLALQYINILPETFSFTTTLTVAALCDGYRVVYHPIDYLMRKGKSKIVPRNFLDFIILLLRLSMLFRPMRLFLPLGASALLIGILKLLMDVISAAEYGRLGHGLAVISNSALLLLLVGVQLLLMGMMAEMVSRRMAKDESKLPSRATVEITEHNVPEVGC